MTVVVLELYANSPTKLNWHDIKMPLYSPLTLAPHFIGTISITILTFSTLSPSGTWWPSANLPRRKGPVCGHWAQIRPSALFLVRQTEPARGSAGLRHQVSAQEPSSALHQLSRFLTFPRLANCLRRYAITVWYFDADERARAKEKYLTGNVSAESMADVVLFRWAVLLSSY